MGSCCPGTVARWVKPLGRILNTRCQDEIPGSRKDFKIASVRLDRQTIVGKFKRHTGSIRMRWNFPCHYYYYWRLKYNHGLRKRNGDRWNHPSPPTISTGLKTNYSFVLGGFSKVLLTQIFFIQSLSRIPTITVLFSSQLRQITAKAS